MKLGEFKSNQEYFARQARKFWKPQEIIATVRVLQVVLFTVLWFKWSVKKSCRGKRYFTGK